MHFFTRVLITLIVLLYYFIPIVFVVSDCTQCCNSTNNCSGAFHNTPGICCGMYLGRYKCCRADSTCGLLDQCIPPSSNSSTTDSSTSQTLASWIVVMIVIGGVLFCIGFVFCLSAVCTSFNPRRSDSPPPYSAPRTYTTVNHHLQPRPIYCPTYYYGSGVIGGYHGNGTYNNDNSQTTAILGYVAGSYEEQYHHNHDHGNYTGDVGIVPSAPTYTADSGNTTTTTTYTADS